MDNFIDFTAHDDISARIVGVNWINGPSARFALPTVLLNSQVFKQPLGALHAGVKQLSLTARKAIETLNDAGWRQRAPADIASTVGLPWRQAVSAAKNRIADLDGIRADWLGSRKVDPAAGVEIRAYLRSLKSGEAARAIMSQRVV